MISRILVPTDFSPAANNALRYAVGLARQLDARLTVLTVYEVPIHVYPIYSTQTVMLEERVQKQARTEAIDRQLIELEAEFLAHQAVPYELARQIGPIEETLENVATHGGYDLVVMGAEGATGLAALLGSTTTHLMRRVSVPVLAVPAQARYQGINRMLLAADYQEDIELEAYRPLVRLAQACQAHVDVLYVLGKYEWLSEAEVEAGRDLKQLLQAVPHTFRIERYSDVETGILTHLQAHPADLLAMMPQQHTLFERLLERSHTTHLCFRTHVPLLTFRA
ncbi:Nucleotide-binding universal stress protein, UspA family [Catalinimonas alkaloidigena]|uniref:Nucleotide-binding universal stress protein, UspA family n=1 Tax=Catalinimonas alkaloidigena TaxID=1075417 RepID=A0A1G9P0Q3_9BACT|nr:universal stress protein [Catalinimonas alkaloidigena]SDL91817.1 Nucleotide-binding universal stress protein, UspA family [Catalinimonas alkaloidigena]